MYRLTIHQEAQSWQKEGSKRCKRKIEKERGRVDASDVPVSQPQLLTNGTRRSKEQEGRLSCSPVFGVNISGLVKTPTQRPKLVDAKTALTPHHSIVKQNGLVFNGITGIFVSGNALFGDERGVSVIVIET